jgi:hypothetical protein
LSGNVEPLDKVLARKVTVSTLCCKRIQFTNAPLFVFEDPNAYLGASTSSYVFTYSLSSAPDVTLKVTPTIQPQNMANCTPSFLLFKASDSINALYGSFIRSGVSGDYQLSLVLSSFSAVEYSTPSIISVKIVSTSSVPPPKLNRALLKDSGVGAFIAFDSQTDCGVSIAFLQSRIWGCDALFTFTGNDDSSCKWLNCTVVEVYLPVLII